MRETVLYHIYLFLVLLHFQIKRRYSYKFKKEKNYYLFFLKAETFMHGELLGMGATMYC